MTFDRALTTFRNEVNLKFPPQVGNAQRTRRINEMDSNYDGYNSYGRNYYNGRGRGNRGRGGRGRGRGRGNYNMRSVQLSDGTNIDVHPAFHFSPEIWDMIPAEERDRIRDERNEHRRCRLKSGGYARGGNNDNRSTISEITQDDGDGSTRTSNQRTAGEVQRSNSGSQASGTIMGGRNEQASQRSSHE